MPGRDYDSTILSVLLGEFPFHPPLAADRVIRRRLRDRRLGYPHALRIRELRAFKDLVQAEVHLGSQSRFYVGPRGRYVEMDDFDRARMAAEWAAAFPTIPRLVLRWFIEAAVFHYHLL